MRAVVDLGYLADGELRVALRGRQALVAEQFLDSAQVGALFQHVRAEGVAQRVRMDIRRQPVRERNVLHDAAHAAGGQAPVAAQAEVEQQRAVPTSLLRASFASRSGRYARSGLGRRIAQRNIALLPAFAAHQDGFVGPVNVA